ncbi:MAG: sel1 repeat family protein [Candidatus Thiodiazotropha taylori]|nr:sel1 repeat family protein [Candidatus Thiodiazotropha taylori]MCW4293117.1 sel1 repeat family protein [Candidatus Thiodiazotropha taylori]
MSSLNDGDFAEAFCLWRPLAMQGHVEAAYHLGWLYANGNGLRVDIDKAVYWWKRSAAQGHNEAMFALALAYTNEKVSKRTVKRRSNGIVRLPKGGMQMLARS